MQAAASSPSPALECSAPEHREGGGGLLEDHPTGADWPSDVQDICPVGRSVLGLFGDFWGPENAPKRPKMAVGAL